MILFSASEGQNALPDQQQNEQPNEQQDDKLNDQPDIQPNGQVEEQPTTAENDPTLRMVGAQFEGITYEQEQQLVGTATVPLEINECILSSLPLDDDFFGYIATFRYLQFSPHRQWRSTPFGVVMSPPRTTGVEHINAPRLSLPPVRRRFSDVNSVSSLNSTPAFNAASSSFGIQSDNNSSERTPATSHDLFVFSNYPSPYTYTPSVTGYDTYDNNSSSHHNSFHHHNAQSQSSPLTANENDQITAASGNILVGFGIAAEEDHNGALFIKLSDGTYHPAVLFSEVYPDNEQENITRLPQSQQGWSSERGNGRPQILFEYRASQTFKDQIKQVGLERSRKRARDYTYQPWLDAQGRIMVNVDLKPLRNLVEMPETVSTNVEGWYLEALFRINPFINHDDIIDRMPATGEHVRPSYRALHQRRARARHIMRITNWHPLVKPNEFWEHIIEDDMTDAARAMNSTYHLTDLTSNQSVHLDRLADNPEPDAKKDKDAVLKRLRRGMAHVLNAGYSEDYWAVVEQKQRIAAWETL